MQHTRLSLFRLLLAHTQHTLGKWEFWGSFRFQRVNSSERFRRNTVRVREKIQSIYFQFFCTIFRSNFTFGSRFGCWCYWLSMHFLVFVIIVLFRVDLRWSCCWKFLFWQVACWSLFLLHWWSIWEFDCRSVVLLLIGGCWLNLKLWNVYFGWS